MLERGVQECFWRGKISTNFVSENFIYDKIPDNSLGSTKYYKSFNLIK